MRNFALVTAVLLSLVAAHARAGDGAIEISHARALAGGVTAGDTAGYPITLSVSGRYVLTSDLVFASADTTGIDVTAVPTVIDLNGFSIRGPTFCPGAVPVCGPTGSGIGVNSLLNGVTVQNGTIQGMGSLGILAGAVTRIENMRLLHNGAGAVFVASASHVTDCTVTNNGSFGVSVNSGSRVADNVIFRNAGVGISFAGGTSGYGGNTIRENNGADTNPQVSANGLQLGPNQCGADLTCP